MFKHFYGLSFNPFDKSIIEKDCFVSVDHKQMVSRLNYLIHDTGGMGADTQPGKAQKTRSLGVRVNLFILLIPQMLWNTLIILYMQL
jgi:hypothetical protein